MISIYPPTKAFVNAFAKDLQMENEIFPNIHHQLVLPCFVATSMSKMKPSLYAPSPEVYAESAINTICVACSTCGYWVHELQAVLFENLPFAVVERLVLPRMRYLRLNKRD